MLISLGPQAFLAPSPVLLVGTYDETNRANIMTVSSAGLCCSQPPCLAVSLRKSRWTCRALQQRKAFTVSIPSRTLMVQADFAGLISGSMEDKFQTLGLTPQPGEHVDAPFVAECPVVLELLLRHTLELGSHIQFIGEIMDAKVSEDCLTSEKLPDCSRIDPLLFAPLTREYFRLGDFAARAFAIGKTMKHSNK